MITLFFKWVLWEMYFPHLLRWNNILDRVVKPEVDHVEESVSAHGGRQSLGQYSRDQSFCLDNFPGYRGRGWCHLLMRPVRLHPDLDGLERVDDDGFGHTRTQTSQ